MGKKAFSLVELLVVISIIALLTSILTPSVVGARRQANRVFCMNNLRQLALAADSYAQNNNDYYPIAQYSWQENTSTTYAYCWDFTQITENGQSRTVPGLLWEGDTIEKVQQCPSYKSSSNWLSDPYTGYNYNTSFIGHGQGESTTSVYTGIIVTNPTLPLFTIVMPAKTTQVRKPIASPYSGTVNMPGGRTNLCARRCPGMEIIISAVSDNPGHKGTGITR